MNHRTGTVTEELNSVYTTESSTPDPVLEAMQYRHLRCLLLEGLASPPATAADSRYFDALRRRILTNPRNDKI